MINQLALLAFKVVSKIYLFLDVDNSFPSQSVHK